MTTPESQFALFELLNVKPRFRPRVRQQVVWPMQLLSVNSAAIVSRSGGVGIHSSKDTDTPTHSTDAGKELQPNTVNNWYTNPALYIQVASTDLRTSPELPHCNPPASLVTHNDDIPV